MLKPGMFISDRYEIIDKVGSGGMADVYKAKCHRLNRFVAIKILKPEYSSDTNFVNKFRNEAQSAAGLSHPNIVGVYDVGDDGELHYIVMELVEGITLKRFIEKKGKLEVKEAVGIAIQIAKGMEAAHDNSIIHRDIKPQNIIISKEGKVKVADFGIAKAINSNTITSNAMGSVHYLSPEQARGGYSDEKSDIYSLGVSLYEMLSGEVPFAGDNTVSVAMLHIQAEATPLRELDPNIPLSVERIVSKCMQKRPERRYHTASDLIVDLKKSITDPDGDFVHIPALVADDSPTINIEDDLDKIRNGDYNSNDFHGEEDEDIDDFIDMEEDDDLDSIDSKLDKLYLAGYIAAAVLLFALVVFLVVRFVLPGGRSKDKDNDLLPTVTIEPSPSIEASPTPDEAATTYKFPSVLNLTEEDAKAAIEVYDPDILIIVQEDFSDEYDEGRVMMQYPVEGADTLYGSEAILTISLGKEEFTLLDLSSHTAANARKKLEEYGLQVKEEQETSNDIAEGLVIRTDPPAGTRLVKGNTVTIVVSSGLEKVEVPLLTQETEEIAKRKLKDSGLQVGEITREQSTTHDRGIVTSQSESAGREVEIGTKIDITVSEGPPEPESYTGSYKIDVNPFDYIDDDEEDEEVELNIRLTVEQDRKTEDLFEDNLTEKEFKDELYNKNFEIVRKSNNSATVIMRVLGETYEFPVKFK